MLLSKGKYLKEKFTYHIKCASLSVSYLAFADDLFLLSGADFQPIGAIKDTLDEFYHSSGLKPNLQKKKSDLFLRV